MRDWMLAERRTLQIFCMLMFVVVHICKRHASLCFAVGLTLRSLMRRRAQNAVLQMRRVFGCVRLRWPR